MSFDIECKACLHEFEIDGELLSRHACDSFEVECPECESVLNCGWHAVVEVQSIEHDYSEEVDEGDLSLFDADGRGR